MKKVLVQFALLLATFSLTACSNNSFFGGSSGTQTQAMADTNKQVASGEAVGGHISLSMDENDKSKLSHALDKPLGKSTQWTNQNTGTMYTVVPTEKLTVNGNPFCRKYTVTASKGDKSRETNGTACVAPASSNWESVS